MRFGKLIIALLTLFLAALSVLVMTQEERTVSYRIPLTFSVQAQGHTESLSCWENPEGDYIVFLPSYAELDRVLMGVGEAQVLLDGKIVTDRMSCSRFQTGQSYSIVFSAGKETIERKLTFAQSANVAALYLEVASGSMEYIHMDQGNRERGSLRLYDPEGQLLQRDTFAELKGRGNTSWWAEKKPYNLTLDRERDLLGMGSASSWILLSEGSNVTNVRNKIVYDFARDIGMPYSPDCEWVDLYLNGEYAGLYLLSERNEIHPNRVDLPQDGSFLISWEREKDKLNLILDSPQVLRIRNSDISGETVTRIWSGLDNALSAEDGVDPVSGRHWMDMIDLDSWARKYLIEEVFANPDGDFSSQFFYVNGLDPEGRIHAGPVWDYDFAMGGEDFWMRFYPSFMTLDRVFDAQTSPFWLYKLYQKQAFFQRLTEIYRQEFLPQMTVLLESGLDGYGRRLCSSLMCDGLRWGYSEDEITSDLRFIGEFMENRMAFLTDLWVTGTNYHTVRVYPGRYAPGYFAVKDGDSLPGALVREDWGGLGWYDAETGEPFDMDQPIHEERSVYIKQRESGLPVINLVPPAALVGILLFFLLLDRSRNKKMRMQK